eukprot:GCRY01003378.1.p1 GENE.GCRY01003378.1~~GCRY01003378.1.p1  ORF type:complete len:214 (+),score=5.83 GCRY01003378.1:90-644(+)
MTFGVTRSFRQKGIGFKLISTLEEYLEGRVALIYLHVESSNMQARAFYEHQGFQFLTIMKRHYLLPSTFSRLYEDSDNSFQEPASDQTYFRNFDHGILESGSHHGGASSTAPLLLDHSAKDQHFPSIFHSNDEMADFIEADGVLYCKRFSGVQGPLTLQDLLGFIHSAFSAPKRMLSSLFCRQS